MRIHREDDEEVRNSRGPATGGRNIFSGSEDVGVAMENNDRPP